MFKAASYVTQSILTCCVWCELRSLTDRAVGGVDGVERHSVAGVNELVVDEQLVGELDVCVVHVHLHLSRAHAQNKGKAYANNLNTTITIL